MSRARLGGFTGTLYLRGYISKFSEWGSIQTRSPKFCNLLFLKFAQFFFCCCSICLILLGRSPKSFYFFFFFFCLCESSGSLYSNCWQRIVVEGGMWIGRVFPICGPSVNLFFFSPISHSSVAVPADSEQSPSYLISPTFLAVLISLLMSLHFSIILLSFIVCHLVQGLGNYILQAKSVWLLVFVSKVLLEYSQLLCRI